MAHRRYERPPNMADQVRRDVIKGSKASFIICSSPRPLSTAPFMQHAFNSAMKDRLSNSTIKLGSDPDLHYSTSNAQLVPNLKDIYDPARSKKNLEMKANLVNSTLCLGDDLPVWKSSNRLPTPSGDLRSYRGSLNAGLQAFLKTSHIRIGSDRVPSVTHSCAHEGMITPSSQDSIDQFLANHAKMRSNKQASTRGEYNATDEQEPARCYESSNQMPHPSVGFGEGVQPKAVAPPSTIRLGNQRFRCPRSTTQRDALDAVAEASRREGKKGGTHTAVDPKALKKALTSTTICFGTDQSEWTTASQMPNWYAPETYSTAY
ncbi:unnamed protein product [Chrysoparadoxa australica]